MVQSAIERVIAVILYSMPEWIKQLDTALFFFLNRDLQNSLFDVIMPFITSRADIILLPFLIVFLMKEKKKALLIFVVALFSLVLADGSGNVLKHLIQRPRPCAVFDDINLLVGCGGSFSMPSNHATNTVAVATSFLFMTRNPLKYIVAAVAVLVGISRVFVGVHYPGDVIAGALVGALSSAVVISLAVWSERRFKAKQYASLMYLFLLLMSVFRMYYILYGPLDLSPDEAHYWEWSRRLDLSYYSKGPMIAYLISAGTFLFGDTVFAIRVLAVLFSALTSVFLYNLGKEMYNETTGVSTAVLFQIIPIYSAYGLLFTIDSPFMFFWALSLYLFWKVLPRDDNGAYHGYHPSLRVWILLGISIGLGLLTKYTMSFFLACAFLFLISSERERKLLKSGAPYLSFFTGILIFTPVILWNAQHGWVSVRHTAGQAHVADGLQVSLKSLFEFIGSQLGVVTPVILVLMFIALWGLGAGRQRRFLIWFSVPILLFFTLKSVQGKVQANWAMMGYVTGLIALSEVFITGWNTHKLRLNLVVITGFVISLMLTTVAHYPSKFHVPPKLDPSFRLMGWKVLGKEVDALCNTMPDKSNVLIFSDTYQVSSELAFYMKGHPVTYCVNLGRRMNQYDLWPSMNGFIHSDGIFVTIDDKELPVKIQEAFDRCEKHLYQVYEKGRLFREYPIFTCHDFKGMQEELIRRF
jgi:membrane-associated phospholipid phosphatase